MLTRNKARKSINEAESNYIVACIKRRKTLAYNSHFTSYHTGNLNHDIIDIDLGKDIAQLFGGGGHPKAASSEFSVDVQFKTIEKIFD